MQRKIEIQRRFWNPVYDRLAWLYDGVDWFTFNTTQRLRMPALEALPPPPARVLEVGMGTGRLHAELAARGYAVVDPVNAYLGPLSPLIEDPAPRALVLSIWPPLAIQIDIWAKGGIGAGRIAVMERAENP